MIGCQSMQKWGLKERNNLKCIKYASNHERPLMKHEEWAKIRPFIALQNDQKQKHDRLPSRAKNGDQKRDIKTSGTWRSQTVMSPS